MGDIRRNHTMREANQPADALAKQARRDDGVYHIFAFALDFILPALRADMAQVCFSRVF